MGLINHTTSLKVPSKQGTKITTYTPIIVSFVKAPKDRYEGLNAQPCSDLTNNQEVIMIQGMDLLTCTIEVFPTRRPSQTCTPFIARELTLGIDMQTSSHPRSIIQSTSQEFGKIGVKQNKQTKVRSSHIQMMYIFTRSFSRPSLDKTQNKTTTHALTLDTHALVDMNLGL